MGGSKDNEAEETTEPSKVPSSEDLVLTGCSLKGPSLFTAGKQKRTQNLKPNGFSSKQDV